MPRVTLLIALATLASTLAASAQPTNLLRNPRFNRDLADWTPEAPGVTTDAVYDPNVDRDGATDSGAARVKVIFPSPFTIAGITSECFPITPNGYYQWSADFFIPSGQVAGVIQPGLRFSTSPVCSTLAPSVYYLDSTSVTGAWTRLSRYGQAPPGMVAARLDIAPVKTAAGGDLVTYVDNVEVVELGCGGLDPATTLCLQKSRFAVTAQWRQPNGQTGDGVPVQFTDDSGYFWFFNSGNVELVVKVLDACVGFQRFWAFSSGLTNVEVDLRVEDTKTGAVRTYFNALNTFYPPLLDTSAFTTCP